MPFFSIIIPTYNSDATLSNSLDSIICQKFNDFEILIMDGLSTDNTLKTVEEYNDSRIRIYSEKDKGIYDAMNKGILQARGEWLYFMGSDDELYDENVLFDIAAFIKSYDKLEFIYGNVVLKKHGTIYDGKFDRIKLYFTNICHQAVLYKKTMFQTIGLYNLYYVALADWDLNMRCFLHPNITIQYVDRIIANYNDLTGFSRTYGADDPLHKERIDFYINKTKRSKEYKIGYRIVKILKYLFLFLC
jgi:glycosyltransferase involved in cell wall biosynthesis